MLCLENPKGRDLLRDIGIDGRITFMRILKIYDVKVWTEFN